MKNSGRDRAVEYLTRFNGYYESLRAKGQFLPVGEDGRVNASRIAAAAGIADRGRLYTNPALKAAFAEAVEASQAHARTVRATLTPPEALDAPETAPGVSASLGGESTKALQSAQRRVTALEQQNAALVAENFELRRQLREAKQATERVESMFTTGRRVAAPPKRI